MPGTCGSRFGARVSQSPAIVIVRYLQPEHRDDRSYACRVVGGVLYCSYLLVVARATPSMSTFGTHR
jgi:hypothetical protein